MPTRELWRRLAGEALGSALLAAVVIGSGIAAQQLSPGNVGLELLQNAAATAAGLYVLILMFASVSGAHFNPIVSIVDAALGGVRWRVALIYLPAQVVGCVAGAVLANLMFSQPAVSISTHQRATAAHFLSETVATAGLIVLIFALIRSRRGASVAAAVGAYIGAAYFFRMFSNTFAGIAPSSVPTFVAAQVLGGLVAYALVRLLYPTVIPTPAGEADLSPVTAAAKGDA
jgi:glycerol uptake facilitator-like aquaporin